MENINWVDALWKGALFGTYVGVSFHILDNSVGKITSFILTVLVLSATMIIFGR